MYIIVGLGNPTKKYENTRHNVGFDTIDNIAKKLNIKITRSYFKSKLAKGVICGQKVLLVKPQTFMNSSGDAIRPLVKFYKINPAKELIVIYDDIDLDVGKIRIRAKGSAGGHNGMKSIIAQLDSEDFPRVRIGIGHKPENQDLVDYVLGHFSKDEREMLEGAIDNATKAVYTIINESVEKAQNDFN